MTMKQLFTLASLALVAGSLTVQAQPGGVIHPFNGKNLDGWKAKAEGNSKNLWTVGSARPDPADPKKLGVSPGGSELINVTPAHGQSLDFYSEAQHGDALITLEGKDANPGPGDMGAIYGAQPPQKPKYKAPGEWNTYAIHWQAPKFDAAGKKMVNAKFLKVVLNGAIIHENVEMKGPTPGGVDGKEKARGPLMFQGNHGPVAYRDIRIAPLQ